MISNSNDYNDENAGTSFRECYPRWGQIPMIVDFTKWAEESFGKSLFGIKKNMLMCHFRALGSRRQPGWA